MRGVDTNNKLLSLESLRGLAAFIVVLFHFVASFFPAIFGEKFGVLAHSDYEWLVRETPLRIMVNGDFAVTIFFVLSGFVLAYSFFKRKSDLVASVVKRYFRLMPVVLGSVLLAYAIYSFNLFFNVEAGSITGSGYLSGLWPASLNVNPIMAIFEGLAGVFMVMPTSVSFNPVLWTIFYEFGGSILVFSIIALLKRDTRRFFVYIFLVMAFIGTAYAGFIIGLILADLYVNKHRAFSVLKTLAVPYKIIALIATVYLASFPSQGTLENLPWAFKPLLFTNGYTTNWHMLYLVSATIMIVLLLSSKRLDRLFSLRPLVYLGSLSYSLYAVHFLVMGSVATFVFVNLIQHFSYNQAALITFGIYILSSFLVAEVFRRWLDRPSIILSRNVAQRMVVQRRSIKD